jgi:hypothetical protein
MCCCASPNVNGTMGYQWQPNDRPSVRRVNAPETDRNVLYDEPGRCGGQDSHCHHYRVVGAATGVSFPALLVRHGGGDVEVRLSNGKAVLAALAQLDSNGRYWLLNALYHAHADALRLGGATEAARWRQAAAEKRIKVRKVRGQSAVRVSIVEPELKEKVDKVGRGVHPS